jgi:energy-coupling factor transporter transmembrane protein EcfT
VTDQSVSQSMRRLYMMTGAFALAGFVWFFGHQGAREAFGFLVGALGSFGNLWLFGWLSGSIAPGDRQQKPWQASLFIGRYFGLFLVGYATVKALDVSPLAVLCGLLASTAAALASSIIELIRGFRGS